MKTKNRNYTTPYKNSPTLCLEWKIDRIDELCEKIAEGHLNEEDLSNIRQILRETQYCIENLYNERIEKQKS